MQKAELITRINQGWDDFTTYLKTIEPEYFTIPTDAAGWTAKDHVMHLAVWENEGDPIYVRIAGNTFAHYPEHIEWIDAIINPE